MSDRKVLEEMFERAGIEFEYVRDTSTGSTMMVERGYIGFSTQFDFDEDGMLYDMSAGES